MSYERVPHEPYPPPGYSPPYPPPPPPPGYPPPPPPPPGHPPPPFPGYQGYFNQGYPPLPQQYPPDQQYQYNDPSHSGCTSFLRACLAALCCCCVLEECCF